MTPCPPQVLRLFDLEDAIIHDQYFDSTLNAVTFVRATLPLMDRRAYLRAPEARNATTRRSAAPPPPS